MLTIKMPKQLPVTTKEIVRGMLGALLLVTFFAVPVMAAEPNEPLRLREIEREVERQIQVQGPRQVFRDDLTVESGQTIEDDVFVYDGDIDIEEGGRITGDLLVFSGDIHLSEGSAVDGDVTAFNGDVYVAGHVGGDLANLSGDIELGASAQVDGDISIVSGDIDRDSGSAVGGNIVEGPSFRFPTMPGVPDAPDAPKAPSGVSFSPPATSVFSKIINFVGRLFVGALLTAFTMLLVGGLFYMRPQLIADTRKRLNEQLALSVVVGGVANLILLFLAGLLAITICLLPLALLPMLGLLAVNVIGWAVASQIVGERIVSMSKQSVQPSLTILVGAFFLTGFCALLWAFGGCFRPLAFLLILVVSSLGTGAALVPWLNRRRGANGSDSEGGGDVPPSGPVPSGPVSSAADVPVETDVAAPMDYVTAEEINRAAGRGAATASAQSFSAQPQTASTTASSGEVVETDVAAPIDYVTAEEINATAEQPPAQAPKPRSRSTKRDAEVASSVTTPSTEENVVEQDVAAPIDYVTAQEVVTTDIVTEGDDFLRIKGIGPSYARRLKEAGYATFAQLAVASPEEIAAAIGWPVDRVRKNEVIDQAKVLAGQS